MQITRPKFWLDLARTVGDILLDFLLSVVFLACGALLVVSVHYLIVNVDRWVVVMVAIIVCTGLARYMAYVFDK